MVLILKRNNLVFLNLTFDDLDFYLYFYVVDGCLNVLNFDILEILG